MSSHLLEKIIFKEAALKILGKPGNVQFREDTPQGTALNTVVKESKKLYDMLNNETSLPSIIEQLNQKRNAARVFRKVTGLVWRF